MSEHLLPRHRSCRGAWCRVPVIADLRADGHRARAIDLPVTLIGHPMAARPIDRSALAA